MQYKIECLQILSVSNKDNHTISWSSVCVNRTTYSWAIGLMFIEEEWIVEGVLWKDEILMNFCENIFTGSSTCMCIIWPRRVCFCIFWYSGNISSIFVASRKPDIFAIRSWHVSFCHTCSPTESLTLPGAKWKRGIALARAAERARLRTEPLVISMVHSIWLKLAHTSLHCPQPIIYENGLN